MDRRVDKEARDLVVVLLAAVVLLADRVVGELVVVAEMAGRKQRMDSPASRVLEVHLVVPVVPRAIQEKGNRVDRVALAIAVLLVRTALVGLAAVWTRASFGPACPAPLVPTVHMAMAAVVVAAVAVKPITFQMAVAMAEVAVAVAVVAALAELAGPLAEVLSAYSS